MIQIQNFSGEIPKLPPHLLPDNAAQRAINCDFAHGELRPLRGLPAPIATPQAVRALFTDDGLRFFAWDIPTRAYSSPTIEDAHDRVYYANSAGFRVTQAAQMRQAAMGPISPTQSWLVGVKAPDQPLVAELIESVTWRTDPAAQLGIKLYYESEGVMTGEVTVTGTTEIKKWREYELTVSSATPAPVGVPGTVAAGTGAVTLNSGSADVYSEAGFATVAITSGSTLTSSGVLKVGGLTYLLVISITYQSVKWDPKTLYQQMASGAVTVSDPNGTVNDVAVTASFVAEVYVYNPDSGFRHFTAYSGNSAQQSSGTIKAKVVGEQTGDPTKFRVTISYDPVETIAYAATVVNDWGEESQSSKPAVVDVDPAQQVKIRLPYVGRAGERPLSGINVYRTYTSSQSSEMFIATPEPWSQYEAGEYVWFDSTWQVTESTTLATERWATPPDGLHSLTYASNGFFVAASGNDLYASEPYHPHAWPYSIPFPHGIVSILAVEGGALVLTRQQCYLVSGAHSAQLSTQVLPSEQVGLAARAITTAGGEAVFVSNDGLVAVMSGQVSISGSQQFFTRQDWRDRYKSDFLNMILGAHDGMVLGLVDPSYPLARAGRPGFLLRLDEAAGTYTQLDLGHDAYGLCVAAGTDTLYVGLSNGFAEFGGGESLVYEWHSKDLILPGYTGFSAGYIDCTGSVAVTLYADDVEVLSTDFTGPDYFRLPATPPALKWSVKLVGSAIVRRLSLAQSFAELKNG